MTFLDRLATALLWLRFMVGYSMIIVAGVILAVIVAGRLRRMTNGRGQLYRGLLALCLGLIWTGGTGLLGVWQYGTFMQALPLSREMVSVLFSIGVLWTGLALGWIALIVVREELGAAKIRSPSFSPGKK